MMQLVIMSDADAAAAICCTTAGSDNKLELRKSVSRLRFGKLDRAHARAPRYHHLQCCCMSNTAI